MSTTPSSFDAPLPGDASLSQENYIQPTLGHGLRIWWAYYWPVSLISFFIIVGVSVLLRKAWESDVLSTEVVRWANRILPYAVIFVVSMIGIRRILGKKFRAFSIALLPRGAVVVGQPLSLSFERTLRMVGIHLAYRGVLGGIPDRWVYRFKFDDGNFRLDGRPNGYGSTLCHAGPH